MSSAPRGPGAGPPLGPRVTRRRFVAGAAAAGLSPFLLSPFLLSAVPRPWLGPVPRTDDPDVLKVGLIGCGGRGTGAAFQAVSAESGGTVKLVAMGDVFADRLQGSLAALQEACGEQAGALLDVPPERQFVGFDAWQRLLASGVDVVLLATPPHFRPELLAASVDAGKHVFCEKPVAVDAPGVRSALASAERARAAGLSLVAGFCWRYNLRHRALYQRVLDGAVGTIQAVYSTYNASPLSTFARSPAWSDMEFQLRNWQHLDWLSGDHVVEQACHSLDKMAWAFGDVPPLSVTAIGGRQARFGAETGNIYDHFGATFEYAGGARGFHMCRQMANCSNDNSDYVYGTQGLATVKGWGPVHTIEGQHPWSYEGEDNDMYQAELDALFAAIRKGPPVNDGDWLATSTLLAIMVRMAAYTGQTISWEQALASTERLGPESYAFGPLAVTPVPVPGQTKFA